MKESVPLKIRLKIRGFKGGNQSLTPLGRRSRLPLEKAGQWKRQGENSWELAIDTFLLRNSREKKGAKKTGGTKFSG